MNGRIERYVLQKRIVSFESDLPPDAVIERVRRKVMGEFQLGPSADTKPLRGYIEGREFHGTVRFPWTFDFYSEVKAEFLPNGSGTTVCLLVRGSVVLVVFVWFWIGLLLGFAGYEMLENGVSVKGGTLIAFVILIAFVLNSHADALDEAAAKTKEVFVSIVL